MILSVLSTESRPRTRSQNVMLTITKEQLIKDRKTLEGQIAAVDAMLWSLFNWKPETGKPTTSGTLPTSSTPYLASSEAPRTGIEISDDNILDSMEDSISYTAEAEKWAKEASGKLMVKHFEKWLKEKFPPHMVNKNSINAPFRKLVKDGVLVVVRQGVGKMPSIYVKASDLQDDDEV